ncbi:MAG: hypothetical protein CMA72_03725 [Euryarchaeota archaeon]|jgi:hypothetical protein|nr:hypothetical protein [Euryarchaeota archaeon]
MNEGVKLLIKRMERVPEEFLQYDPRWEWATEMLSAMAQGECTIFWFTSEEKAAMIEAYRKLQREDFHRRVVESVVVR